MGKVYIGIPSYGSTMVPGIIDSLIHASTKHPSIYGNVDSSACAMAINILWCNALAAREAGHVTHFLLWHSDVVPERFFLDKMMDLMEKHDADVLSAVIPIKSQEGMTSTALDEPVGDMPQEWRVRRLTMKEVLKDYPPTFTDDKLLLNTGLMLVNLQKPWVFDESLVFTIRDKILRWRGQRLPAIVPEDWGFSRMARNVGAKLWATSEIAIHHYGQMKYPNSQVWGTMATDAPPPPVDRSVEVAVSAATAIPGYMDPPELNWLAEMANKATAIVEIGSWKGRSTKALAAATKGVVYAVDNWKGTAGGDLTEREANEKGSENILAEFKAHLADEIAAGKVVIVNADHATAMDEVRERLGGNVADMVFIDGDHEYEAVKRDITNYTTLLKPGGLLCGHDCSQDHPGVVKALKELIPEAEVHVGSVWSCRTEMAENGA